MPYIGRIAFNGNDYSDGGEVQFYAQALGVVAAENKFTRTGGLSAWASKAAVGRGKLLVAFVLGATHAPANYLPCANVVSTRVAPAVSSPAAALGCHLVRMSSCVHAQSMRRRLCVRALCTLCSPFLSLRRSE